MPTIHTHYDNLTVSRSASPEVIRAAYKTLAQKFHPDRNRDNLEAARIMAIINSSYEILSDPLKRFEYDAELKKQELASLIRERQSTKPQAQTGPQHATEVNFPILKRALFHIKGYSGLYLLAGSGLLSWYAIENSRQPPEGPKPYSAEQQQDRFQESSKVDPDSHPRLVMRAPSTSRESSYVRSENAPNGQPWPTIANYIPGYRVLHTNGLSNVTVDNRQNNSEVFVKLVSIGGPNAYPVRQFYIPARSSFTVRTLRPGSYDVRHRDLNFGQLTRSAAFELNQTETQDGTQYSNITLTLFKVQNGNMQSFGLSEQEF
jgi:curved DNA-binding protein CbpA